jgi:hypothetical protein
MTATPTIPPLTGTVTVDAAVDRAFRTFTEHFGSWWPAEYHIGQADMATAILEPRQGGRWYEQGTDGSEIEVRFSADAPDQTTATLEHRHLARLVDGQALRDGITGGGGWSSLLELLAKAATNQA